MDKRKLHAGIIAGTILAGVGIAHIFASSSNKKTSIPINHEPLFVDLRKMAKLAAHSNTNFKNFEKKYMINQRYVPQSEFCKNDVILSDKIKIAKETVKTKIGRNTIVIGNSGSGKSKLFVEPNIKFSNNSMVVVDQFGEFYKNNASDLEKRSYKVYRLDFNDSAETPDLSSINREKTAVFVTFPREEASTIISAFFGTLFDILFCDGNKQLNGKPYIGVDIFLDDWSISKNIPDLHTKIAICRVYNVGFFIIVQSVLQLDEYKTFGRLFIANSSIVLYYGSTCEFDKDWFVRYISTPRDRQAVRHLIDTLDNDSCIIRILGEYPFVDKKYTKGHCNDRRLFCCK